MDKVAEHYALLDNYFRTVQTPMEAFAAASCAAAQLGFPHLIHAPVRNHPNAARNWSATSYPSEWQQLYVEKNYLPRNPVRKHTLVTSRPFRWSQLERSLPKGERELFHDCRSVGMVEGVVVPVHGPWSQAVAVGFACREKDAVCEQTIGILQVIAMRLHYAFDRGECAERFKLTPRERQVLLYVSEGHENRAIADFLNITDGSVEWHLKNIFTKLEVGNRTAAVVKAIQTGTLSF